ncbi:MAG TPA: GNAT family N-acetyltransferase [Solirubrobacteraceae bacterium]|nr:GNAT family N-acetyltransferase [Solirubrobacteraceae bacterium]
MGYDVRALTVDDLPDSWELSRIAFGSDKEAPPGWLTDRPGRVTWGVFDERGRLVAKAMDRDQGHWFGGRLVPATGLAGVATVPELRGAGLGRIALTRTLHAARERGAVIATLFRSGPRPYRSLGCEEVGALTWVAVPAAAFAAVERPRDFTLRAAEADDAATVDEIYRTVARASAGMIERSGSIFEGLQTLERVDGVTLAVGPGGVEGYASWDREPGYDETGRLAVFDLIGLTADATLALLAMLGTWRDVAPTIRLRLPDPDPLALLAPLVHTTVESRDPWMLRVLDAAGAVAARGWPPHLSGAVDLALDDDVCPWNSGSWRLVLDGGAARLEPGGDGAVRFTMRGLAVWYAGAADPAVLRRAGLLAGDESADAFLAAASAGPRPALQDYF